MDTKESRGILAIACCWMSPEQLCPVALLTLQMGFRPVHTDGGRRGKAACCRASRTHPRGRQSRYSRNGIRKSQQSCGTGPCRGGEERLADDIRAVPIERLADDIRAVPIERLADDIRAVPYGTPSLQHLSDWLSASLYAAKAGSGSPLQQPGHPFRWQQCYRFSDIADATAWTYLSGCMREASWRGSLVLMGTSCGRGEEGAAMQSRRHPVLAGRRPLHLFRKCWRVAVSAYAGAAICFFGPILRSGFRAWERQSGPLQN